MCVCCHPVCPGTLQAVKNAQSKQEPVVEGEGGGVRGEGGEVKGEGDSEDATCLSSKMEDTSTAHLVFRTEEDIEGK